MTLSDSVLAMMAELPARQVTGKKRLQKLLHLLQLAGADIDAEFRIHHYGPFSFDVVDTIENLVLEGKVEERIQDIGIYDSYVTTYTLNDGDSAESNGPEDSRIRGVLARLTHYRTVELEVASTIGFFERAGMSRHDAIERTKEMKRSKTSTAILQKSQEILSLLS